jgi:ergothioneine biosynthesis protein EgtB
LKLASIQFRRQSIAAALAQTRQLSLDLFAQINELDESLFFQQAQPEFSPIGWHFGHIAFTEAYWILECLAGLPPSFSKYQRLFAADGLPKHERQNLPSPAIIKDYLHTVRAKTLDYLATAPLGQQERLWRWLVQHESQHGETISFILQLHQQRKYSLFLIDFGKSKSQITSDSIALSLNNYDEMVRVEAGELIMGSNAIAALDNERPAHKLYLDTYWIDRYPVTCGQYSQFIAADGYQKPQYWSKSGWQWLQQNPVSQPLYWSNSSDWLDHPVCGVSYYEAEAYANFAHKRLPTEAEWSKAALGSSLTCNHSRLIGHTTPVTTYPNRSKYGCQDMLGNVWEWTASWFAGYPGFAHYPYQGYSEIYFDGQHRVLRGGSWATSSASLRTSFRNWYHPEVRQIFAGFRCVKDR